MTDRFTRPDKFHCSNLARRLFTKCSSFLRHCEAVYDSNNIIYVTCNHFNLSIVLTIAVVAVEYSDECIYITIFITVTTATAKTREG